MVIEIIIQNFNIQIFDDSHSEQYRYNIRGTTELALITSAANRLIGEVVQSRRRPLLGPSPG